MWKILIRLNVVAFRFLNFIQRIRYLREEKYLTDNVVLKDKYLNKSFKIICNGPSLNDVDPIDITGNLICMNRAFYHKDYAKWKPLFHVLVDPKLVDGTWNWRWLLEIQKLSPETIVVLSTKYTKNQEFMSFLIDKNINHIFCSPHLFAASSEWIVADFTKTCTGLGAPGVAVMLAHYLGAEKIIMFGKDGNGLFLEIMRQKSHFYGENEENKLKNIRDYIQDLYMMTFSLLFWLNVKLYLNSKNVTILNNQDSGVFSFLNDVND